LEELAAEVRAGRVDTVLVGMTDMHGRLQGKRADAQYFLDEIVPNAVEGCNYLLAVDVDMNTVDGYELASWDRGYGDFVLKPDLSTLRRIPWHVNTAFCVADIVSTPPTWGLSSSSSSSVRPTSRRGLRRTAS
jgi:glutamine synthetase